jgi:tetratricopeptide (TPR) repeat protein
MTPRKTLQTLAVLVAALLGCAGGAASRGKAEGASASASSAASAPSPRPSGPQGGGEGGEKKGSIPNAAPTPTSTSTPNANATANERTAAPAQRTLSPRAQRLFEEAVAAREEMARLKVPVDWETLERRWRAVVEAEDVPEAWFNLGVALEHRRQLDDARAAYRRAVAQDPGLAPAAVNLALLDEPKDPREAGAAWAELMRRFPQDPVPPMRLASLYEASGQLDDAFRLAREALVRDPKTLGAYEVMMRVALARGNTGLAQLLAVKAEKLFPGEPAIVALEGDVRAKMGDDAGATALWTKAVQMRPDFLPARYALLQAALAKRLWEAAAEQARAILGADPSDARVQLALGIAYRYLGQPDKALAQYDQAEKLSNDRLDAVHLARGVTLMKSKEQCEPAIAELRRYVAIGGPLASEGPAMKLMRECEQILAANRQAEEAAREMKAQAERDAAKKTSAPPQAQPAPPAPADVPAKARPTAGTARAEGRNSPTR